MIDEGFVMWNSSFSVLHAELDAEHRKIMNTLNRLHCLEREGVDGMVVLSIFQDLVDYTEQHCAHEEELMLQWKFDGCEAQRIVHQELIQRTRELTTNRSFHDMARFRRNIIRLNQWWVGHIQTMDHKYIHAMSHSR